MGAAKAFLPSRLKPVLRFVKANHNAIHPISRFIVLFGCCEVDDADALRCCGLLQRWTPYLISPQRLYDSGRHSPILNDQRSK